MTIVGPGPTLFDPANLDLRALAWNPSRAEAKRALMHNFYGTSYDSAPMSTIELPTRRPRWATALAVVVVFVLCLSSVSLFAMGSQRGVAVGSALLVFAAITALATLFVWAIIRYLGRVSAAGFARVKLERLGADNAWDFRYQASAPGLPGCIFATGTEAAYVSEQFITYVPRQIIFGNFNPAAGVGDGGSSGFAPPPERSWGFLAIRLAASLPGLLLISRTRQPGEMRLPVEPRADQVVGLEGDFDSFFTLYCSAASQQDALYVITPDLMALLIDKATPFDVEIAGEWMFFYSRIPFDMLDPAIYQRLFDILKTIGGKVGRLASRGHHDGQPPSTPGP